MAAGLAEYKLIVSQDSFTLTALYCSYQRINIEILVKFTQITEIMMKKTCAKHKRALIRIMEIKVCLTYFYGLCE